MSALMEDVVETIAPAGHESSYGIQNLRYIFQILTDAVAIRQVVQM